MTSVSRVHGYKSGNPNALKGEATEANLRGWSNRASKNSYHGPSSQESGSDYADTGKNHGGDSTFMKGVRRQA